MSEDKKNPAALDQNQQGLTGYDPNAAANAFGFSLPPMFTTLDPQTQKALIFKALGTATTDKKAMKKGAFTVAHFLLHKVNVLNEKSGSMVECTRSVLISPNGETVAFVSDGIGQNLRQIVALYGMPIPPQVPAGQGWKPPLELLLDEIDTRSGRRTYQLLIKQ